MEGVGSCHRIIGVDIITETRPKPRRLMEAGLGVPELEVWEEPSIRC